MKEVWKPVVGYEGLYEVSNLGRVKSLHNNREKILRSHCRSGKYMFLELNNNGRKSCSIHRLVAEAFIPNPENKPCVNHKNGIKTDNRVENLEWCSHSENSKHAFENGLLKNVFEKGERHRSAKLTKKQVIEIRSKYKNRKDTHKNISKKYGVSQATISNIINRVYWKHV